MDKDVKYSVVPVGKKFEHNGVIYTRYTHNRGIQIDNGKQVFKTFPKHRIVKWINAWGK